MTAVEFQVAVGIGTVAVAAISQAFFFGWQTSKLITSVKQLVMTMTELTAKLEAQDRIIMRHEVHLATIEERCKGVGHTASAYNGRGEE